MTGKLKSLLADFLVGLGGVCVVAAAWQVYRPAAWLVGGLGIVWIGVALERS